MQSKRKYKETENGNASKGRRRPVLAALILLAALIAVLACSDVPFIKEARNSLLEKAGIVQQEEKENGQAGDGSICAGPEAGGDTANVDVIDPVALPEYDGHHYVTVNGNMPEFPDEVYAGASLVNDGGRLKTEGSLPGVVSSSRLTPYEHYGELDSLGRCTAACGCLGEETMPAEGQERGDISEVHPSGWAKAQNWERCHLIAWALGAENANPGNLITGTHYLNYDGMRPLEEEVEHYIWDTGNHVLYMAVPWFSGDELVARGVQMTARSVEDNGEGISFNVYCFNVTPNASIDYRTGIVTTKEQANQEPRLYVINKRSGVFHYPSCEGAQEMPEHNREEVTATRVELTSQGYTPCGMCEP